MTDESDDLVEYGIIKVSGHSGFPLRRVRDLFLAFERAYNSILAFIELSDTTLNKVSTYKGELFLGYRHDDPEFRAVEDMKLLSAIVSQSIDQSNQLILFSVRLQSPGFWEILGNLNPLEVIRQYLNDRHERMKDRKYRIRLQEQELIHRNTILENEALSGRVDLYRRLGYTENEIRRMMNAFILAPLSKLDVFQDCNMINSAVTRKTRKSEVREHDR